MRSEQPHTTKVRSFGVRTNISTVYVPSAADIDQLIASYVAKRYVVSNRTANTVILFKKKEFEIAALVVGLFLCIVPALIYWIIYEFQTDKMVYIRVGPGPTALPQHSPALEARVSDDGKWWWDGKQWQPMPQPQASAEPVPVQVPQPAVALEAPKSEDGRWWWDGQRWQPMPQEQAVTVSASAPDSSSAEQLIPASTTETATDDDWYWDGQKWMPKSPDAAGPAAPVTEGEFSASPSGEGSAAGPTEGAEKTTPAAELNGAKTSDEATPT